jgi:hypothetical protein
MPSTVEIAPTTLGIVPTARSEDESRVVALLRAGIPLSLLMDIAQDDPRSVDLYAAEHAAHDWITFRP